MKIETASVTTQATSLRLQTASAAEQNFDEVLQRSMQKGDQKKLYKACQDMESVLLNKMLAAMRQTVPRSEWMGQSFATETFEAMLDEEYARLASQNNSLGIADILYRQLSEKLTTDYQNQNIAPIQEPKSK